MKTVTTDEVIRMIELNEITIWQVSTGDGDNRKVFDSIDDETLEARKTRFRQVMELYPAGRLILTGKKNKNDTRGGFRLEFSTNSEPASVGSMQAAPVVQGMSQDEVTRKIAEAIEAHDTKRRLQELESENKELKKVVENDSIGRILSKAEPLIAHFISRMIPARPAVQIAGIEGQDMQVTEDINFDAVGDIDDATTDRVQVAIEKWADADDEFIEVLEFISDFASTGKKINAGLIELDYHSIKKMLLNK